MADSPNLILPYIQAAQAQKHVTHNEAIRLLDGMVQLAVLSRVLTAPPGSPTDGDRYIVASGATGLWAGWDLNVAFWVDGAWLRLIPRVGWIAYSVADAGFYSWNGTAWSAFGGGGGGGGPTFPDDTFGITGNLDPTKIARFEVDGFTTGTTRTFTLPDISTGLVGVGNSQTITAAKTFSGTFTVSSALASLMTSTATSTANVGNGATTSGQTKTINLGTDGLSGSTTVVNIGSAVAGALGSLVINSPTVTFAASVSAVAMAAANLSALYLGLGGATADATNRLSINTPAVLFNHAGASIQATLNKNAAGNDAGFIFQTAFSTRALFGTLGSDDFRLSVSPDGSSFFDAFTVARATGRLTVANGLVLNPVAADLASPVDGLLWYNSTLGKFRAREGGATVDLISAGGGGGGTTITGVPTADQIDFNPAGMGSSVDTILLQPTTNSFIGGLVAGAANQVIKLVNDSDFVVCLFGEDGSSAAANRFDLEDSSWWILPQQTLSIRYSSTLARWVRAAAPVVALQVTRATQLTLPNTTTTVQNVGAHSTAITATLSTIAPVATPTNEFQEYAAFQVTNATAAGTSGVIGNVAAFMRGATAKRQGFFHTGRVRFTALGATGGVMAGLTSSVAAIAAQPSTVVNSLLLGANGGQTTLRIFHGAAAAGTPVDLGANFPVPSATAAYEYCFYAAPATAAVQWMVRRLDTRFVAEGTLTANIPVNTVGLAPRVSIMVGATAAASTAQAAHLFTKGL